MTDLADTIFASTLAAFPSAIAIVRISGSQTRFALETMTGGVPAARHASLKLIRHPHSGEVLDRGLVLWFPGPESFTGEDTAEFHVHGSRAIVVAVLAGLSALAGMRPAEAGEFTHRAFLNGKMDLTAVEGMADLLSSETEVQRRQALRQGQGHLGEIYDGWRARLLRARAMIEAELDFADEDDVPGTTEGRVWPEIAALARSVRNHLDRSSMARTIRSGMSVVLQGAPNVGKSSLLNALAARDAAIVSDEAGTTRDVVTVPLDLGGYLFSISDTAGLRDSPSPIEAEGVRRARKAADEADLVLRLSDTDRPTKVAWEPDNADTPVWDVRSKADLIDSDSKQIMHGKILFVSARTGEGLSELEKRLAAFAEKNVGTGLEDLATRQRHVDVLHEVATFLEEALRGDGLPIEVRAEALRTAADGLGRLTGRIDVEDLLDVIFSEFCIGK